MFSYALVRISTTTWDMVLRQFMLDNPTKKAPDSHSYHPIHYLKTSAWENKGQ